MLFFILLVVSIFSLVYELLLSTLSSYLIGNSVLQFSLTIGIFIFGLGIGSYLSRYIKNQYSSFIKIELTLGILGGFCIVMIKFFYVYFESYLFVFYLLYYLIVILIGFLTGLEPPIIANIVNNMKGSKNDGQGFFQLIVSDIFTYDYLGSLLATFLFPFLLLPFLGLTYTATLLGLLNITVGFAFLHLPHVKKSMKKMKIYSKYLILSFGVLLVYILLAIGTIKYFDDFWYNLFFKEPIIYKQQTQYQEIVITKRGEDIRLYSDGHLQFLSLDEERYHYGLWYMGKILIDSNPSKDYKILIMGGGDGLLARTIFEYNSGSNLNITLVDIDKAVTDVAKTNNIFVSLNKSSLNNPNLTIVNEDAFKYIENQMKDGGKFDIIIADFPDPRDVGLSKLYSYEMYGMVSRILDKKGVYVTQASNAFFAKESFWCIKKTMEEAFENGEDMNIIPFHVFIPSFGDWGFVARIPNNLQYKNLKTKYSIDFDFDYDHQIDFDKLKTNKLDNPVIIDYYLKGRKRFNL